MQLTVPRLDDGVVALRPPETADVEPVYEACQDPAIARFTTIPWPYEREHAVSYIRDSARHWREGTGAPFLMVDSARGAMLGSLGLVRLEPDRGVAEVGYFTNRDARGRGVAPRGVRLVTDWVLRDLGIARLELQTDVRNHASQRVAEKAGFRREGEVPAPERCAGRSERMIMFALTPADLER